MSWPSVILLAPVGACPWLEGREFLALLGHHPEWDWRRRPSTDLR